MKLIGLRKALALGGLLTVTLAAGCAGGQGWSNNPSGYYGNSGFGAVYPYNSTYRSSYPYNNGYNRAYAYSGSHGNTTSRAVSDNYGRVNDNRGREQQPQADRRADRGHDQSGNSERESTPVYR